MTNHERIAMAVAVWATCLFGTCTAQTRGPVSGRTYESPDPTVEPATNVSATESPVADPNEESSRWPLNLGRKLFRRNDSGSTGEDPFLNLGSEEQQRLAVELAGDRGLPTTIAAGQIQSSYPWPRPVDSSAVGTTGVVANATGQVTAPAQRAVESAAQSGSRIVDAVRRANARAVERFGSTARNVPNVVDADRSALTAGQPSQHAETATTADYAQQAVNKYMQRIQQEGTANGQVFDPLAAAAGQTAQPAIQQTQQAIHASAANVQRQMQPFQQGVQAAGGIVSNWPPVGSAAVSQVTNNGASPPIEQGGAPSIPITPTFAGVSPQATTRQPSPYPSYVQPTRQYGSNVGQAANTFQRPNGSVPAYANASVAPPNIATQAVVAQTSPATNAPIAGQQLVPPVRAPLSSPASPPNSLVAPQTVYANATPPAAPSTMQTVTPMGVGTDANNWIASAPNQATRSSSFPMGSVQPVTATALSNHGPAATASQVTASVFPQASSASPQVNSHQASHQAMPGRTGFGTEDKHTRVLAIVGDQSILAGDVLSQLEQMLKPYRAEMTAEQYQEVMNQQIQKLLPRLVENKLVYLDFLRTVPVDKLPELEAKVMEYFNENELPKMREKLSVTTDSEIDEKLREQGSSLAKQQKMFLEQFVGREAVRRNVDTSAEITHSELLEYFHAHKNEFSFPTQARWERISVEIASFGSRDAARNALAEMGNAIMKSEELEEVAKKSSQGPRAKEGGQYDWTTIGSLRSDAISNLVFNLPVGKLSSIIESDGSLHIVRVVERKIEGVEKFAKVQNKISDKIKEQRFKSGAEEYLERLRRDTYVWTAFDGESVGGRGLQVATPTFGDASVSR